MKRSDIREAYDCMNPTQTQRDQMYRAIMKKSERQYAQKTVMIRRLLRIPAAVAMAVIVVIGAFAVGSKDNFTYRRKPTEPTEVTESFDYEALLNVYRTAVAENWTAELCIENGISPRLADAEYMEEKPAYIILDIDGNGVEELVIGNGMPHYFYVWDLYTFEDDQPVQLHNEKRDGSSCHIYENGIVGIEYTGKTEGYYHYFGLQGTMLVRSALLSVKDDQWKDDATNQPLTQDEALTILGQYEMMDIYATGLMDYSATIITDADAVELYTPVLEKYKTALLENWTWAQCDEVGISPQIIFNSSKKNEVCWCLLDLDGNGKQELIISDGMYLFDLYTLTNQPVHLLSAYPEHYTLCKDGTIEKRENVLVLDTYWRWYSLEGTDLVQCGVILHETDGHKYSYGITDDSLHSISENEAGRYLTDTEKSAMKLTLIPFVDKEYPEVKEPNFYYESIIETYRTAVAEHWDPGKCMENGISLMVGYYGGIVPDLGHNQIDLNGDGSAELIITDGTNIYDMYTIVNDEEVGPLRLIDATERNQFYLTTDGQIYNIASGSAMLSYYYLFDIGQKELVFDKGLKFDASVDPNNPWSYYEESMDEAVACTTEDARVIMDAIHFEAIPFIPFTGDTPYGESKIN